jgi:hypothetical protein
MVQRVSLRLPHVFFLSPARLAARDAHVRETWVRAMEARIVRDMLKECHRVEGVNHYENCRDLADRYTSMLEDSKVRSGSPAGCLMR